MMQAIQYCDVKLQCHNVNLQYHNVNLLCRNVSLPANLQHDHHGIAWLALACFIYRNDAVLNICFFRLLN